MYHGVEDQEQVIKSIQLSGSDLQALRLLLRQLLTQLGRVNAETGRRLQDHSWVEPEDMLRLARRMLVARRRRVRVFNKCMFGEPAWDMLLALYLGMARGPRYSVSRLSSLSGSPPTTALRWLDYLAKEQLIVRTPHPTDRRSDFVELTDRGRAALEQYLSETLQSVS